MLKGLSVLGIRVDSPTQFGERLKQCESCQLRSRVNRARTNLAAGSADGGELIFYVQKKTTIDRANDPITTQVVVRTHDIHQNL